MNRLQSLIVGTHSYVLDQQILGPLQIFVPKGRYPQAHFHHNTDPLGLAVILE